MSSHPSLEPSRSPRWGRAVAISLGWTKGTLLSIAALLAFATSLGSGQDPAGRGMAGGFAFAAMLYLLALVAPALILAHRGRQIGLSLALLLLPAPVLVLAAGFL